MRVLHEGVLHTLVYDRVAAMNMDPVEKKPLYHFHPGHMTFSLGTMGCNMDCSFCQNHSLSQPPREGQSVQGTSVTPAALVDAAKESGAASISYTYSEPTIFFELLEDTARLAKTAGLHNILVSNGFMTHHCLEALEGLIDAANIDLKAFSESFYTDICGARLAPVLENLKTMRRMGWWIEVTTLLIPGANDSDEELRTLAAFIRDELGAETPWHVSRFRPTWKMTDRGPTPVPTMERALAIGKDAGLEYIYLGNVPGHDGNSTCCPTCGNMTIKRHGFQVLSQCEGATAACPGCGHAIAGKGL